jgi:hypothetical protein
MSSGTGSSKTGSTAEPEPCPSGDLTVSGSVSGTLVSDGIGGWTALDLPIEGCTGRLQISITCSGEGEWALIYVAINIPPNGFESPIVNAFTINDPHTPDITVELTSDHCGPLTLEVTQ